MTVSIINSAGEILHLDACTAFGYSRSSSLTKNPIDGTGSSTSGVVTDHVVVDNERFTLTGVISNADWHYGKPSVKSLSTFGGKSAINDTKLIELPTILESATSLLNRLPFQFTFAGEPLQSLIPKNVRADFVAQAEFFLKAAHKNAEFVTLVDSKKLQGSSGLIITDISWKSDDKTGDALFFELQLERPVIVQAKRVAVKAVVEQKAAATKNSGTKGSSTTSTGVNDTSPSSKTAKKLTDLEEVQAQAKKADQASQLKLAKATFGG